MTTKTEEVLETILKRNPDVVIENRRNVGEDAFVLVGKELIGLSVRGLGIKPYLTSHTPNGLSEPNGELHTSYRLWIEKPVISLSGHPDWDERSAVVEMWQNLEFDFEMLKDTDERIFGRLRDYWLTHPIWDAREVVKNPQTFMLPFCSESRIYRLT
jgi:hypothetical protein